VVIDQQTMTLDAAGTTAERSSRGHASTADFVEFMGTEGVL